MQDPSSTFALLQHHQQHKPQQFPEQEQLRCPRCDSTNTKFCYYNNYNLSQPRHFCKSCRRYWTKGGALRNIPVGGGTRKTAKRSSAASATETSTSAKRPASSPPPSIPAPPSAGATAGPKPEPGSGGFAVPVGGFTSLLSSNGQFGNLLEGMGSGPGLGLHLPPGGGGESSERLLGGALNLGESTGCWGNSGDNNNQWPDLAIFTPGSRFQ